MPDQPMPALIINGIIWQADESGVYACFNGGLRLTHDRESVLKLRDWLTRYLETTDHA